ncbi:MAG: 16S rRNA (uracil(1498)-N(3))-methyltransferase [Micrococcales bacterium]|nr:16S rRNA (uracil(1498)-N(3))-methyltransferase [Micrococcales bacterium]
MTAPVFFSELGAQLSAGDVVTLDGAEGHHAASVFRLRSGEVVDVVNGAGLRASATVGEVGVGRVDLVVAEVKLEAPPVTPITLVQALAKQKRDELALTAAVELGVDRLIPWQAERSVVRRSAKSAHLGFERWSALARAAAKVSRRAYLPSVEPVVTTSQLVGRLAELGGAVVVLHEEAPVSLPAWYANWSLNAKPGDGIVLVVGPEGGISSAEVVACQSELSAQVVGLGPNVLRSSTAGPAALAVLAALLGRWDN